jgi:PAS domain S-box-containing protein
MKENILIADDEKDILNLLAFALETEGYGVITALNGEEALALFHEKSFDLVLTDIKMPVMDGLELLRQIKQTHEEIEVIILTGHATMENAIEALKTGGAFDFLQKPLDDIEHLIVSVNRALERRRLRLKNREMMRELQKLSQAVHQSPGAVMITDVNGSIEYVNPKFTEMTGYAFEDAVGKRPNILKSGMFSSEHYREMWDTILKGEDWRGEFSNKKKSGESYWELSSVSAIKNEAGEITHFVKVAEDITERKQAEAALKESEQFNIAVLNSLPSNIVVLDKEGRILKANQAWKAFAEERFGERASGTGMNYLDFCVNTPESGSESESESESGSESESESGSSSTVLSGICSVMKGETDRFEVEVQCHASPRERWFLLQACRIQTAAEQIVISQVDITLLKQMEKRMLHSQKMDAIATLAGGIAHEFNNALAGVMGNIELLELQLPENIRMRGYTEKVNALCRRMSGLAWQLLAYAKGGQYYTHPISLRDLVEKNLPVLRTTISPDICIETRLSGNALIKADSTQIQMVLAQILKNASEAMKGDNGLIRITVEEAEIRDCPLDLPNLAPVKHVCLTVEDNGKGMDENTRSKIFDPFFSTKFVGRGLGMAAVYGVVKNHNGDILVESAAGKGTTVKIYFPILT